MPFELRLTRTLLGKLGSSDRNRSYVILSPPRTPPPFRLLGLDRLSLSLEGPVHAELRVRKHVLTFKQLCRLDSEMPPVHTGGELCPCEYTRLCLGAGLGRASSLGFYYTILSTFQNQNEGLWLLQEPPGWLMATPGLQGVLVFNGPHHQLHPTRLI